MKKKNFKNNIANNNTTNNNTTNNNIEDNNIENNIIENNIIENNIIENNNIYLKELLRKQLKNIPLHKKLNYNDIRRISKFISSSIFDENKCSIWNGYITNEKNKSKGTYINFYFNKKKIALHRLLYINYIEDISNNEYIKFTCINKGKCCNLYHMVKNSYNKNSDINNNLNNKNEDNNEIININTEKKNLIIEF